MAHFVRCIDGHVFDASKTTICPICGAAVAGLAAAAVEEPPSSTPQAAAVTGSAQHMPLLAAIALLVFGAGAGALFYVLHRPAASTAATGSNSTSKGPDKAASMASSAAKPPTAAPPAPAPPSDYANSGQAPAPALPTKLPQRHHHRSKPRLNRDNRPPRSSPPISAIRCKQRSTSYAYSWRSAADNIRMCFPWPKR